MSNDPYVAPSADLQTDAAPIKTSIWNARGRLGILSYLAQSLLLTLFFFVILGGIAAIAGVSGGFEQSLSSLESDSMLLKALPLILLPIFLLAIYLSYCLLIKRLHDRDHIGWWSLLSFIPVINIAVMIYIMCFPGQKHANRYGGQRITKGWEKVLAILFIILLVIGFVGGIAGLMLNT